MTMIDKSLLKTITVNFHDLHVKTIGHGEPIVFLHGGPGSEHRFFLPHVLPLARTYQLIFYDQTGCGHSAPHPNDKYSMKDEVKTLELLRQELNLGRINIFGESWGSMLALLYATSFPSHVNKLLLTAAVGATAEGFKTFGRELEKRLTKDDQLKLSKTENALKKGEASVDDILAILDKYYVYSVESLKHKAKTTINSFVNEQIGEDIIKNYDITDKLDVLQDIQILVAQGSNDILTPHLIKPLLLDYIPHAELVEIDNCGHWTVVEKADRMNEIALNFFLAAT